MTTKTFLQRSWTVTKNCYGVFNSAHLSDRAAALTYYGMLGIFPAFLVALAIFGLIGKPITQPLTNSVSEFTPGPTRDVVINAILNLQNDRPTAGVLLVVGLGGALWSASSYLKSFSRASNAIYGVEEERPFWRRGLLQLALTFGLIVVFALVALAVTLSGPLADRLGHGLGIGDSGVMIWDIAKWPIVALIVVFIFEILYHLSPSIDQRKFRWLSPGGFVALGLWILVSAGFAFYVSNFSHYNQTYGSLGGVIVFLIWLWLSNVAFLLGLVLNAELTREEP